MNLRSAILSTVLVVMIISGDCIFGNAPARASSGRFSSAEDAGRSPTPPRGLALTNEHEDLISIRSLSVVVAGGLATWVALRSENHAFIRRYLDRSAFDLGCDAGDAYGTGIPQGIGILGLMTVGHIGDHSKLIDAGQDLSLSLMTSGAITWALKIGINRKRPNGGKYSFPSGHTAVAFSTVPVIAHHFGWKAGITAGALAGFTALGRMEENKHYLSDVVFGASIGLAAGYATVARKDSPAGLGFLSIGPEHAGIRVRF